MSAVAMYSSVQTGNIDAQIMQHAPLVKRIAYHLLNKLPDSVQVDDLIQAGMLGLLESMKNYDASKGASFDTYAGIRIRGSMLDEVRRCDWVPRSVYKKSRIISDAIRILENQTGCAAKDSDVAEHLGISLDEYFRILRDSSNCRVFSIEELSQTGDNYLEESSGVSEAPLENVTREGFQKALSNAIASLPERERLIISLYYDEELNLREIGKILNLTESRVSQISSQAVIRLRSRLSGWIDND
jgi:RNA polymerase sigma factor for flagellar operon FliA